MTGYTPPPGSIPTLSVPDLAGFRRMHLVGIGGAGMSGIARLLLARGFEVSGSDLKDTPGLAALAEAGATVHVGHGDDRLGDADALVMSTAIGQDNPEVATARARGIPVLARAQVLAALMRERRGVAIAGTHGKTTTTSMIAVILERAGLDPTYVVGGDLNESGSNARSGNGDIFVAEADESDGSFLLLSPEIAVVTNIELDHHTTFASMAELEAEFERWLERVPRVVRGEDLAPVEFELAIPGEHNRRNAAAAIAAVELATGRGDDAAAALREFAGAGRRFELKGEAGGIQVYDDYAHHPTEVEATLAAARSLVGHGRVVALFQPHLYSRTVHLATAFARALAAADAAVVTEIYPAREAPWPGVSGKLVVDRLAETRPGMPIGWAPGLDEAGRLVVSRARPGDIVLTIGAGDVDSAAERILELLGS